MSLNSCWILRGALGSPPHPSTDVVRLHISLRLSIYAQRVSHYYLCNSSLILYCKCFVCYQRALLGKAPHGEAACGAYKRRVHTRCASLQLNGKSHYDCVVLALGRGGQDQVTEAGARGPGAFHVTVKVEVHACHCYCHCHCHDHCQHQLPQVFTMI